MKYTIILAALLGLMTSEQVYAIQKHQSLSKRHVGSDKGNTCPPKGGKGDTSGSESDSGSDSESSGSESEGGQQQQQEGGQQQQQDGAQQAEGGQQQQQAEGGQQQQAEGGQQQQAEGGQQQQAEGGQQQQAEGGQQQQAQDGAQQAQNTSLSALRRMQQQAKDGGQQTGSDSSSDSSSGSDSESDSENDDTAVQTGDYFYARDIGAGFIGKKYLRVVPARFSADSDDVFMRSMINNYAAESKDDDGVPTGNFFLDAAAARRASSEVLGAHAGIKGDDAKAYLDTYFQRVWDHFDVNGAGMVGVEVMPQFMRMMLSDQYVQL